MEATTVNFDQAVLAHSKWKVRLKDFINGKEQLDADALRRDDQCELGKWIAEDGHKHGGMPEFAALKEKHTHFHRVAGDIAHGVATRPKPESLEMLDGLHSEFTRASSQVVSAIMALKSALK